MVFPDKYPFIFVNLNCKKTHATKPQTEHDSICGIYAKKQAYKQADYAEPV